MSGGPTDWVICGRSMEPTAHSSVSPRPAFLGSRCGCRFLRTRSSSVCRSHSRASARRRPRVGDSRNFAGEATGARSAVTHAKVSRAIPRALNVASAARSDWCGSSSDKTTRTRTCGDGCMTTVRIDAPDVTIAVAAAAALSGCALRSESQGTGALFVSSRSRLRRRRMTGLGSPANKPMPFCGH